MSARRPIWATLVSLCALMALLALGGAAAQASITHSFLPEPSKKFGEDGLQGVNVMTLDSAGLYVGEGFYEGESQPPRLRRFEASTGALVTTFPSAPPWPRGLAVGHSTGEPETYVMGIKGPGANGYESEVDVFDAAGVLQNTWTGADTPSGFFGDEESARGSVAVDESGSLSWAAGDVYALHTHFNGGSAVDVFKPEAGGGEKYVTRLEGPEPPGVLFGEPLSVAVNQSNDEVLVVDATANGGLGAVDIFKPSAIEGQFEFVGSLKGPPGTLEKVRGVTVDNGAGAGSGDIYGWGETGVVDQFNAAGVHVGTLAGTPAGGFGQVASVVVEPKSHDVYVGVPGAPGAVDVFGPDLTLAESITGAASDVAVRSATLNGTVELDKAGEAKCRFEWGTTSELGQEAKCEPEAVTEEGAIAVHARLNGVLASDTTYYYRLLASNVKGTSTGETKKFTTPGPALLDESASNVASTSATLDAVIEPHNAPTSYYFQYGTSDTTSCTPSSCSSSPSPPGVSIGSRAEPVEVHVHLLGFAAGSVYHYRVVAVSEVQIEVAGKVETVLETIDGADQTFTTQTANGGSGLLDGREWEMVSPPEKRGAALLWISVESSEIQASAGGDAIAYMASTPTEANPPGYQSEEQVLSTRGPGGWESRDISPPHEQAVGISIGQGGEYRLFSPDLSRAVVQPFGGFVPSSSPWALSPKEASEQTPFLRTDYLNGEVSSPCLESCYRPLVTGKQGYANVPPGIVFGESEHRNNAGERTCPPILICGPEFLGSSPDLRHIVVSYNNAALTPGSNGGLYEWNEGVLAPVGSGKLGFNDRVTRHAVSDDGSRVAWSSGPEDDENLYLTDTASGKTVQLGPASSRFQTASSDGSRVFFTLSGDLYECEIVEAAGAELECKLSDLGSGLDGVLGAAVLGASEDGRWVYFVSTAVLAEGEGAVPGDPNLYVWHDGKTRLVAVLSRADFNDWKNKGEGLSTLTSRVSPNGMWLAFMSQRGLTGYDTRDAVSGQPDEEVYLYSASSGRVVCASCNPTGARPVGVVYEKLRLAESGGWESNQWIAANVPGWTPYSLSQAVYQSRYLSDSGRLFFNSSDALVAQDVNGTEDVYEYEPSGYTNAEGKVQCTPGSAGFSERSDGCVGLVSSGTSAEESAFLDASETGGDVFFLTKAKLAPQDFDTAIDVYDAHECTVAAPCLPVAAGVPPPCVTGDACKPGPTPQPAIYGSPSSETFSGAGNIVPSAPGASQPKGLTRSQQLARALKACRKERGKRRAVCERQAKRRYGTAARSRKASATKRGGGQ
jgi:hypothetical protein